MIEKNYINSSICYLFWMQNTSCKSTLEEFALDTEKFCIYLKIHVSLSTSSGNHPRPQDIKWEGMYSFYIYIRVRILAFVKIFFRDRYILNPSSCKNWLRRQYQELFSTLNIQSIRKHFCAEDGREWYIGESMKTFLPISKSCSLGGKCYSVIVGSLQARDGSIWSGQLIQTSTTLRSVHKSDIQHCVTLSSPHLWNKKQKPNYLQDFFQNGIL